MGGVVNLSEVRAAREESAVRIKRAVRGLIQRAKADIRVAYPDMTEREIHQYLKRIAAALLSQHMNRPR